MPPEYDIWQNTLHARDMVALAAGLVAVLVLVMARRGLQLRIITKSLPRLNYAPQILLAIIFLGFGLRVFHLGQNALWYDEALTALTAQRNPLDILTVARYSSHPPGYYLLMWLWSGLWDGLPPEWWLRLPSLVFGTANIGLTYALARALHPKRRFMGETAYQRKITVHTFDRSQHVALTAALIMALAPFQLFYSQEARMYTMLLFFVLLTALAWQKQWWPLFILAGTAILYTQIMGALFLLALAPLQLFRRGHHWPFLASASAIGLLYAPWAYWGLFQQIGFVQGGWIPQVTLGSFLYLWHVLLWGEANPLIIILPGMALSIFTTLAALWLGYKGELYSLLILTIFPPLLAVLVSLTLAHVFLPGRPFITVTPFLYILIAYSLWHTDWGRVWAGVLTVLLVVALWGYYFDPALQKWPHRQWATEIEQRYQPGDAVFYVSHLLPFWWYLHDKPSYFLVQDDDAPNAGFNLSTPATIALGIHMIKPEQLTGYKRAFVLHAQSPAATPYRTQVYQDLIKNPNEWQEVFVEDGVISSGSISLIDLPPEQANQPQPATSRKLYIPEFVRNLYHHWQTEWRPKAYVIFK